MLKPFLILEIVFVKICKFMQAHKEVEEVIAYQCFYDKYLISLQAQLKLLEICFMTTTEEKVQRPLVGNFVYLGIMY